MARFSKQELKVMHDPNLSLIQKAEILRRSMSSIRSKHWAILNKQKRKRSTVNIVERKEVSTSVSKNLINISIDNENRKIILSY